MERNVQCTIEGLKHMSGASRSFDLIFDPLWQTRTRAPVVRPSSLRSPAEYTLRSDPPPAKDASCRSWITPPFRAPWGSEDPSAGRRSRHGDQKQPTLRARSRPGDQGQRTLPPGNRSWPRDQVSLEIWRLSGLIGSRERAQLLFIED